jgi:hypothetical protein
VVTDLVVMMIASANVTFAAAMRVIYFRGHFDFLLDGTG